MNVEMRGVVEFAGSARSDLCILLDIKDEESAFFLTVSWTLRSPRLASVQLPEQQQTSSSLPEAGRLPLWQPSSPRAPSLFDVSSARFYYEMVSSNNGWERAKSDLIFSPEASSVGSIPSCPSFVRIGSLTGRSFSGWERLPSGIRSDMSCK